MLSGQPLRAPGAASWMFCRFIGRLSTISKGRLRIAFMSGKAAEPSLQDGPALRANVSILLPDLPMHLNQHF